MARKCFLFLVVCTTLLSCGKKSTAELVEGRWKIDDVTQKLTNIDPKLKAYYEDQLKLQTADLLESGYYEFKKGGEGLFEVNGQPSEGKWRLSEDGKKIFFKEKGDTEETSFDIKEISESVFVIEVNEGSQTIRIIMKKKLK